ncbi:MAG: carbon monoxide dehydrogenase subunit G [Chloroflexi bacterium]|nr:carbon monoxide dehydrogenase subunit G [Chloroflexota bacterium]
MKLNGSYTFPIARDTLWAALMDPEVIGACLPGVQSFSAVAPDTYAFEVGFRVGIVSGAYKGTLEVRDVDAPNSYRMVVQGAGIRTDMKGEGSVALTPDDATTTTLTFDGDVNVTGILARVGQRMMGTVAKQQIDRLFQCLSAKAG